MAKKTTNKRVRREVVGELGADIRVALYLRRSTDEENQQYTFQVQEDRMRAYVASQPGWRVVVVYDDNKSGASTDRKGLDKMMTGARAGLFDVVLVYRVDRFSRNLRDLVMLLDDLDEAGVVFRSATEPFDTGTPMGRLLVQMLGMFAQFERDLIIERVIAGMEKAAAAGKWKGGRRPYGYGLNKKTMCLTIDKSQAVVVRLIFAFYTVDRLGSNAIANLLNDRGLRTSTGKQWSPQQVLRVLSNRVYLGELTFRDITAENCHPAIIEQHTFDDAQRLMEQRGESYAARAGNDTDFLASGKLRCPRCHKAMIGTRANGRTKTYRYYTCWTRSRYGPESCDMDRIDADQLDAALLNSMATFFRTQHDLMAEAVTHAQRDHESNYDSRQDELDTVNAEISKVIAKIDRYLDAFEDGTLEPADLKERLTALRETKQSLQDRRDGLMVELSEQPVMPDTATLTDVSDHINDVIRAGNITQQKSVVEALVSKITMTQEYTVIPTFRIPQQPPTAEQDQGAETGLPVPTPVVRVLSHLVELRGIEPRTFSMRTRRATNCATAPNLVRGERIRMCASGVLGGLTLRRLGGRAGVRGRRVRRTRGLRRRCRRRRRWGGLCGWGRGRGRGGCLRLGRCRIRPRRAGRGSGGRRTCGRSAVGGFLLRSGLGAAGR